MQPNSDTIAPTPQAIEARKQWMGVLAKAGTARLEQAYADLSPAPEYDFLRPPEVGMAMVRARAEGGGDQFNLGEMTMVRCSVKLSEGTVGHGYVAGRNKRHAELAAVFDALLQTTDRGPVVSESVIALLHREQIEIRRVKAAKTAATKVNFFTMVRGEDQE